METRQKGSHIRVECGRCMTLLRRIERDLEPCLGKGWLKKSWESITSYTNAMLQGGG